MLRAQTAKFSTVKWRFQTYFVMPRSVSSRDAHFDFAVVHFVQILHVGDGIHFEAGFLVVAVSREII